jgi:predicted nuclease of predicted toxin-antitoxin system
VIGQSSRAREEQRIVVTFDLDFGDILAACGDATVSVIIFRLHDMTPKHVIDRFRTVIAKAREPLSQGVVVLIEETRLRIRRLLIGS